jgi:mutator protein MutT
MQRRYPERPLVGVGAVVIDRGRVLLVKRANQPLRGEWSIPGGMLEAGETLESAVCRELKEETGLDAVAEERIDIIERILRDDQGRVEYHYVLHDYTCRVVSGELRASSDASEARWFSQDELDALKLAPATRAVIDKAFRGEVSGGSEVESRRS